MLLRSLAISFHSLASKPFVTTTIYLVTVTFTGLDFKTDSQHDISWFLISVSNAFQFKNWLRRFCDVHTNHSKQSSLHANVCSMEQRSHSPDVISVCWLYDGGFWDGWQHRWGWVLCRFSGRRVYVGQGNIIDMLGCDCRSVWQGQSFISMHGS